MKKVLEEICDNQDKLISYNNDIKYQYDVNGIRACKLVKGLETRYITQNNQIICEENNNGIIIYQYILNKLVGFTYTTSSGTKKYLYIRNIQGDITSIIDSEGNKVCSYIYDGYGNHIVLNQYDKVEDDPLSIGHINPFRYRGYYFDEESGLYYLNSRYYDPETGRFISPDVLSILDETKGQINGLNLYMYCGDNPIMYVDPSGYGWIEFWKTIFNWFKNTFGFFKTKSYSIIQRNSDGFFGGYEEGVTFTTTFGDDSKPISLGYEEASEWWKFWEYKFIIKLNFNKFSLTSTTKIGEYTLSFANEDISFDFVSGIDKIGVGTSQSIGNATYYNLIYIKTIPTAIAIALATIAPYLLPYYPLALAF